MKVCKAIAFIFVTINFSFLFAQNNSNFPTNVEMPKVSVPKIGNGFYVPGSEGFYSGQKNVPSYIKNEQSKKEENSDDKNQTVSKIELASSLNENSSILNSKNLSANDLLNLSNSGILDSLPQKLISGGNINFLGETSNAAENILLENILKELSDLKKANNSTQNESQTVSENKCEQNSKIVRFVLNSKDFNQSLKSVYISKLESDGTFLVTGDRNIFSGQKSGIETFYLLFHAKGNVDGATQYVVTAEIAQDFQDFSSEIYKLCSIQNLSAQKTGNFVILKVNEKDLKGNLLISVN